MISSETAACIVEALSMLQLDNKIGNNIRRTVDEFFVSNNIDGALGKCSYCETVGYFRDVFRPSGMSMNRECLSCNKVFYTRPVGWNEKI